MKLLLCVDLVLTAVVFLFPFNKALEAELAACVNLIPTPRSPLPTPPIPNFSKMARATPEPSSPAIFVFAGSTKSFEERGFRSTSPIKISASPKGEILPY